MKVVWILRHILTPPEVVLIVYFSAAWHGLCLAVVPMNPFPEVNCRGGVSGHYFRRNFLPESHRKKTAEFKTASWN